MKHTDKCTRQQLVLGFRCFPVYGQSVSQFPTVFKDTCSLEDGKELWNRCRIMYTNFSWTPKRLLFCIFSSVDLDWKLGYVYQTKLDFFLVKAVCVYDLCERFPLFLEQFSYYASFQHVKVLFLEYDKSVWGNTVLLVLAFVPPSHPPPSNNRLDI